MKTKRPWVIAILVLLIVGLGVWLWPVIQIVLGLGLLEKGEKRTWTGDSLDNLRRQHVAMTLYLESEGQFPSATGWMDAIEPRLKVGDMSEEESKKKLVSPPLLGRPGQYGYAMNEAASQKIPEEIENPDITALIFESQATERNAQGDPARDMANPPRGDGNHYVTISGNAKKK
ncbi:MAG: hypothetical protein MUC92_08190 [Fimbriimonadaceae bacterium]|nr:hypothetical protein [Fimbriimonadaceae bacterium]